MKAPLLFLLLLGALLFFYLVIFLFTEQILEKGVDSKKIDTQKYVSGVIPHHLLAKAIIEEFLKELSKENYPQEIVLIGPDHFNAAAIYGNNLISLSTSTPNLENLSIDGELLNVVGQSNNVVFSDYAVKNDHGIMNILPFIKNYFPKAKIIPFLIPADFPLDKTKQIVENLNKVLPENSFILASVDFSHYLPKNIANFHDQKSIRTLLNFEEEEFLNIEVDCPQCLFMVRHFAKLKSAENYKIINHKNSQDFSNNGTLDSTTSYFSILFSKEKTNSENMENPKIVLFLGDIMLDRAVKRLMDKNGILYPFERIKNFLKGVDVVVGNLEGPIVNAPQYTPDISLKFNFGPEVLESLRYAKINLVSLANNHTIDVGKNGLDQTKELLNKAKINYFGDPITCAEKNIYKDSGIVFIGINSTFPINCSDEEIRELIKKIKKTNPNDFVVVFIHWGEEYKGISDFRQKEIAHAMIDSGADLIIGSHPHVVEEIEQYKNALIFYSLGNFIFDQYFSEDIQKGLAVGLELYNNKAVFRLFPIESTKSQPYLLENSEKETLLGEIASKSSSSLGAHIKKGVIEIGRK